MSCAIFSGTPAEVPLVKGDRALSRLEEDRLRVTVHQAMHKIAKRGTIEFDTPAGGQISVLGIRTTPLGTTTTLTTIPALASVVPSLTEPNTATARTRSSRR